jgi:hypothetical protein
MKRDKKMKRFCGIEPPTFENVTEFIDNDSAIAGGLIPGMIYHTNGTVRIVEAASYRISDAPQPDFEERITPTLHIYANNIAKYLWGFALGLLLL